MPELPEVETVRKALVDTVLNTRIDNVTVHRRDLRTPISDRFEEVVKGAKIVGLERRGKYIRAYLDNDDGLVLHLGMSGVIAFHPHKQDYQPAKHDHIIFEMADGGLIAFNDPRRFGQVVLFDDVKEHMPIFKTMGPEPLSDDFTPKQLAEALKDRSGPIKTALMDQSVVAGLGNIYVCEALYYAGISPKRKSLTVQGKRAQKLHKAIVDVLRDAIQSGGSSLKDYKKVDGAPGYFQHKFAVYNKKGRACPDCTCEAKNNGMIENLEQNKGVRQMVQAGRSTFFCSTKQR